MRIFVRLIVLGMAIMSISMVAPGQKAEQQTGVPVSVTVTVTSKNQNAPPVIPQDEVVPRQDGNVRPVISWVPANGSGAGLDLVVLVDSTVTTNIANRLTELQDFLRSQPESTLEGIAYGQFGEARFEQELTANHDTAAKALRMPGSNSGQYSGIYDAGRDLITKWPESKNCKAAVLISDGNPESSPTHDPLLRNIGAPDLNPTSYTSLQRLIEQAQRSGVTFYVIYTRGATALSEDSVTIDQSFLARLAKETGGDSFLSGSTTPVSLQPYLQNIAKELGQQYILTFAAKPPTRAGYSRFQVIVKTKNVGVLAPEQVYVPGNK